MQIAAVNSSICAVKKPSLNNKNHINYIPQSPKNTQSDIGFWGIFDFKNKLKTSKEEKLEKERGKAFNLGMRLRQKAYSAFDFSAGKLEFDAPSGLIVTTAGEKDFFEYKKHPFSDYKALLVVNTKRGTETTTSFDPATLRIFSIEEKNKKSKYTVRYEFNSDDSLKAIFLGFKNKKGNITASDIFLYKDDYLTDYHSKAKITTANKKRTIDSKEHFEYDY